MVFILLIIGIIIGYIRKGKINSLASLQIKFLPLIILSFLIQISIYIGYQMDISILKSYDILLHFVSYIILFAGLMSNFENKWFIVITLGVIGNFMVIFLNGGKMPVSLDAATVTGLTEGLEALMVSRAGTHQLLNESTILPFLGDIIPMALPEPVSFMNNIYSIGDVILYIGTIGLLQSAMVADRITAPPVEDEELTNYEHNMNTMNEPYMDDIYMTSNSNVETNYDRNINQQDNKEEKAFTFDETAIFSTDEVNNALNYDEEDKYIEIDKNNEQNEIEQNDKEQNQQVVDIVEEEFKEKEIMEAKKNETTKEEFLTEIEEEITKDGEDEVSQEEASIKEEPIQKYKDEDKINREIEDHFFDEENNFHEQVAITEDLDPDPLKNDNEDSGWQSETQEVDTIHQFIIIKGKIIENPNYNKNVEDAVKGDEEGAIKDQNQNEQDYEVNEIEMSQLDLLDDENATLSEKSKHALQKISDTERIDLMKKMKERKEKGYNLVQIQVGDKKINFWKKELGQDE